MAKQKKGEKCEKTLETNHPLWAKYLGRRQVKLSMEYKITLWPEISDKGRFNTTWN